MMKRLLIVDDTLPNLQLLGSILKDQYSLSFASDGKEALELLEKDLPDLILLDIMMPGIDGFEVCRRIRKNEKTHSIPIIFLSAKNDRESVIKGMGMGAQDYIVKPFMPEEVIKRIALQFPKKTIPELNTNCRTIKSTDKIFLCNRMKNTHTVNKQHLAQLVEELSSVEEKLDPLISNIPDLLLYFKELEEFLLEVNLDKPEQKKKLEQIQQKRVTPELTGVIHTMHDKFLECQFSLIDLINDLNTTGIKEVRNEIPSLRKLLENLIILLELDIKLNWNIDRDLKLPYKKDDFIQVILSLLDNAFDAMMNEENTCSVTVNIKDYQLLISVEDSGPGIPSEAYDSVWDSGFSSKKARLGYGLTAAKNIIEEHFYGTILFPFPDKGRVDVVIPLA
ncbi:MAG: response regulator [Spirochaetales bacterium]|nr:response regulator [Spirochaetales bacterium]